MPASDVGVDSESSRPRLAHLDMSGAFGCLGDCSADSCMNPSIDDDEQLDAGSSSQEGADAAVPDAALPLLHPGDVLGSWSGSWEKDRWTSCRAQITLEPRGRFTGRVTWSSSDGFVGSDIDGHGEWKCESAQTVRLTWAKTDAETSCTATATRTLKSDQIAPYERATWDPSNNTLTWAGQPLNPM